MVQLAAAMVGDIDRLDAVLDCQTGVFSSGNAFQCERDVELRTEVRDIIPAKCGLKRHRIGTGPCPAATTRQIAFGHIALTTRVVRCVYSETEGAVAGFNGAMPHIIDERPIAANVELEHRRFFHRLGNFIQPSEPIPLIFLCLRKFTYFLELGRKIPTELLRFHARHENKVSSQSVTLDFGLDIFSSAGLLATLIISVIIAITLFIVILTVPVIIVQVELFNIVHHFHLLFIYLSKHAVLQIEISDFHLLWLQEYALLQLYQMNWFVLFNTALLLVDIDKQLFQFWRLELVSACEVYELLLEKGDIFQSEIFNMVCWIHHLQFLQVVLELFVLALVQIKIICGRFCVDLEVFEYIHEGIKSFGCFCRLLELELILFVHVHGGVVTHFENIETRILASFHSSQPVISK